VVHAAFTENSGTGSRNGSSECGSSAAAGAQLQSENLTTNRSIPIDSLPDGYCELDLEGCFTFVNETLCNLLGKTQEDLLGNHWRRFINLLDQPVVDNALLDTSKYEGNESGASWSMPDGTERRGQWALRPIGEPTTTGNRGFLRDVTENETKEIDIRLHCQRLEALVAQQHDQLTALGRQFLAAQKMEAIGTLSGSIAHNFNNILMGVQGSADLIRCQSPTENNLLKHLDRILRLIDTGSRLTRQLLGYVATNKPKMKQVSIKDLLKTTADLILSTRSDIRITFNFPEDPLWCAIDQGHLEQVFMNLFVNAMDAMPDGGRLTLTAVKKKRVDVLDAGFIPIEEEYAIVEVKDTGHGIAREIQANIFEPLYTTKSSGKGTGLGLSSVQMTLKHHGGHISVVSNPGEGALFTLWIPIADKSEDSNPLFQETLLSGNETILLFDADPVISETFSAMLETLGYQVVTTTHWSEVAETLAQPHGPNIDLGILDLSIFREAPGESIEQLKKLSPGLKLIFTSGRPRLRARGTPPDGRCRYLQKPFSMTTLSTTVREVLGKNRIRRIGKNYGFDSSTF
jgi:two-component system, cell cycle sensor histidine kinase and response regulator CckA